MAIELTHADAGSPAPSRVLKPLRRDPAILQPKTVILFGRDDRGRPHGARFAGCDEADVERAADLMDLYCLVADTTALSELAAKLPAGRLFSASGKALVPFVKADLYERLIAAAGPPDTPLPFKAAGKATEAPPIAGAGSGGIGGSDGGDGAAAKRPAAFDQIGIGSVVLACQGPMEGWWEAVVTYTKADDHFVLRWRDFPDDGEITRARKDLGLLPPHSHEGLG